LVLASPQRVFVRSFARLTQGDVWQMQDLIVAGSVVIVLLCYFLLESLAIARARASVPVRICVTGTRGKSSVVRLIAAGLRKGGKQVVAKTTGSKPVFLTPTGDEVPLRRRGGPRILEQGHVLRLAKRCGAEVLVCEVMSIRPENYATELHRILQPQCLVVTNVRLDHLADLAPSVEEASRAFADGAPPGATVFTLSGESPQALFDRLEENGVRVIDCASVELDEQVTSLPYLEWKGNLQLALGVCEALGVPRATALSGMRAVRPDYGALKAWRIGVGDPPRPWIAVSAFAANEPGSTLAALNKARDRWDLGDLRLVGLLNLRSDRADRTEQWCRTLGSASAPFDRLFVAGGGASAAVRHLRKTYPRPVAPLRSRTAEGVLKEIRAAEPEGGVLFGFGNIARLGTRLVDHWERVGEPL
jgi:poly-gamma-glutamate synthase PgsB/CapB